MENYKIINKTQNFKHKQRILLFFLKLLLAI